MSEREEMVDSCRDLLIKLARQAERPGYTYDDAWADGFRGLWEAAESFDASRGGKFVTHAYWQIRKELRDGQRAARSRGAGRRLTLIDAIQQRRTEETRHALAAKVAEAVRERVPAKWADLFEGRYVRERTLLELAAEAGETKRSAQRQHVRMLEHLRGELTTRDFERCEEASGVA